MAERKEITSTMYSFSNILTTEFAEEAVESTGRSSNGTSSSSNQSASRPSSRSGFAFPDFGTFLTGSNHGPRQRRRKSSSSLDVEKLKFSEVADLPDMTDKDYAPLSAHCVKALCDKMYEKRKAAALEIEKLTKVGIVRILKMSLMISLRSLELLEAHVVLKQGTIVPPNRRETVISFDWIGLLKLFSRLIPKIPNLRVIFLLEPINRKRAPSKLPHLYRKFIYLFI